MTLTELAPLLAFLDERAIDYSATMRRGQVVTSIWVSSLRITDPNYHGVLSAVTRAFDRLNKEVSGGIQSWNAMKDGTSLTMYRVAACKVVGYKTVEKKKMVEVETDEIEVEEQPIYDCSGAE